MARRYFIVVGDPTTAGGQALAGYAGGRIQCVDGSSRPVVRVGDPVLCGQCGPTIVTSGYPFAFCPGADFAYDGSDLACGHKMVSTLQRLASWDDPQPRSPSSAWAAAPKSSSSIKRYFERYRAIDEATGKAVAGQAYRIEMADGTVHTGETDSDGMTIQVITASPEQVTLTWLQVWHPDQEGLIDHIKEEC